MTQVLNPRLGIHLLETITRGVYSEPMHAIREYVQNAFDSIRQGRSQELIKPSGGSIKVLVDPDLRRLTIHDSGVGLSPEEAVVQLLDIGLSQKAQTEEDARQNIGFRGIGRMAGISYCKKLRFETSNGKGKTCIIEFDAEGINNLARPGQPSTDIHKAISQNVTVDEIDCAIGRRYFDVILDRILDEANIFLNIDKIRQYLELVAPVDYDPSIWTFGQKIAAIAKSSGSSSSLSSVHLAICDAEGVEQVDVRRPFCDTFAVSRKGASRSVLTVSDVRPFAENSKSYLGWWGWIAEHPLEGALRDTSFAGIGVRMHNMAIGDHRVVGNLFKSTHLAKWCFGEIHITDARLVPNAQRDNFEPSKAWRNIQAEIREEVSKIERLCRKESDQRSKQKRSTRSSSPSQRSKANLQHDATDEQSKANVATTDQSETVVSTATKGEIVGETASQPATAEPGIIQQINPVYQDSPDIVAPSLERRSEPKLSALAQGSEFASSESSHSRDCSLEGLDGATRTVYRDIRCVLRENLSAPLFEELDLKIVKVLQRRRDG